MAPQYGFKMHIRYGTANASNLEFTFNTTPNKTLPTDLFFMHPNDTHFLLPVHLPIEYAESLRFNKAKWTYQSYAKFDLCSVAYQGYKMLAPCNPEEVIKTGM